MMSVLAARWRIVLLLGGMAIGLGWLTALLYYFIIYRKMGKA